MSTSPQRTPGVIVGQYHLTFDIFDILSHIISAKQLILECMDPTTLHTIVRDKSGNVTLGILFHKFACL